MIASSECMLILDKLGIIGGVWTSHLPGDLKNINYIVMSDMQLQVGVISTDFVLFY